MMESSDHEVLRAALDWLEGGRRVILITVARTWGSSPRPVGSLAAVRDDGQLVGSVSGGCVEEDLVERITSSLTLQRGGIQSPPSFSLPGYESIHLPEVVSYGISREEARRFGLPCGGRLELVLEPLADPAPVRRVLEALAERRLLIRRLDLASGELSLHPASREQAFSYDGRYLEQVFGPTWRLLIIGANQLARFLAEMALALDYHVIVCDPRTEILQHWSVPGVELDSRMPDDAVLALADDERSAVVALTHDPRLDDMALIAALDSKAFYVGALGSRISNAKRRERLALLEVSEAGLARLHGPVGLPIGSRTPAEIAVAILAELTAVRHGVRLAMAPASSPDRARTCR
jgi:xanthine dehydrogenase accessory factor